MAKKLDTRIFAIKDLGNLESIPKSFSRFDQNFKKSGMTARSDVTWFAYGGLWKGCGKVPSPLRISNWTFDIADLQ
jgi:hypothetical protein